MKRPSLLFLVFFTIFCYLYSIENPLYVDSGQNLGSLKSFVVALGDLDGDSDLDAFVQNQEGPNKVWLNDGNGIYFDSGQEIGYSGESVDLYDLDGDNDLDAVIITHRIMSVWFNDGNGNFTNNQTTQLSNGTNAAIGDLDKDGDLDAFVANYYNQPNKVWLNTIDIKVEASIDIDPNTLNKKSKGKWVTCFIELPEGNDVNHIDLNTVELEYDSQIISAERGEVQDNLFMAKFSRQALIDILGSSTGNVELKVSGKVASTLFEGTDTIRVK